MHSFIVALKHCRIVSLKIIVKFSAEPVNEQTDDFICGRFNGLIGNIYFCEAAPFEQKIGMLKFPANGSGIDVIAVG